MTMQSSDLAGLSATALRDLALSKLKAARALADADGAVPAESSDQFRALMAEFSEVDRLAARAQTDADDVGRLDERLAWYTGKVTGQPMTFRRTHLDPNGPRSLGEQFVQSDAFKALQASGALDSPTSKFDTGRVGLGSLGSGIIGSTFGPAFGAAASDIIQTESGGPAAGLVTPYYYPGILPLNQRPLTVRDIFPVETINQGDHLSYAAQTGFDNAAAAVAQATATNGSGASGGVKPQSSIAWARRTAVFEWIATWMAVTRQTLSDASIVRSLIDNQGRLMIRLEEEDQILSGDGNSPNLSGIRDQSGLQTLDLTGEDNLDGIRSARTMVATGLSRLEPTFIVLNPLDSEAFDLLKDENGQYRGGNPIGDFGFGQSIWRLRRVESEAVEEGVALVGARGGATIIERQPITVLTADQHSDFFVRNLSVILFEERIGLPVWFPTAFVEVTLDPEFDGS